MQFDFNAIGGSQEDGTLAAFGWHPVKNEILSNGGDVPDDSPLLAIAKEKGIATKKSRAEGMVTIVGAGREIYRDEEYIEIVIPKQRDVVHRPVADADRQRWAKKYAEWKAGRDQDSVGTPIDSLTFIPPSIIKELRSERIKTVEALAGLNDESCSRMFGVREYRDKAKAFLSAAQGQAPLVSLQTKVEELTRQNDALQKQIRDIVEKQARK